MTEDLDYGPDAMAHAVQAIVRAASPLFYGQPAQVTGAALADLLAMWLSGHVDAEGDDVGTSRLREKLLEYHLAMVRQLLAVNDVAMQERIQAALSARTKPRKRRKRR